MLSIIGFLVIGLIAGFLARLLVPGKDPMGILGTLILGLTGSLLGGFLASALFNDSSIGLIGSVAGSVLALLVYRAATGSTREAA